MICKKILNRLIIAILAGVMLFAFVPNIVCADTSSTSKSLTLQLSYSRYTCSEASDGNGGLEYEDTKELYYIKNKEYRIFQILSYDNDSKEVNGINYYCVKAKYGDTWENGGATDAVEFTGGYDLTDSTDIATIEGLVDQTYQQILNTNIYTQLMWIFDHMYTGQMYEVENTNGSTEYKIIGPTVEELLENAGMYKKNGCWYYDNGNYATDGYDAVLTGYEIEAIQQVAIWYYTNYVYGKDTNYNLYEKVVVDDSADGSTVFR